jgi:3',5'-cyclic AMP phosphodiesterase CpdA
MTMRKIFEEHPLRIGLACLFILSFIALQFWNCYAPLRISGWNSENLSQIKVVQPEDFTFAVFGDNKGNYSFFEPLLHDIARDKQIAFAVDMGDLVSDGKRRQFRRFLNQVQEDLKIPFMTAVGNHDLNGGGSDNYREIFGSTYYAFQVGQSYFIVLDATTEAGFDQTELKWLEEELKKAQASKVRFVFMHVPPFDPRGNGFHKCLNDGKELLDLFKHYHLTHLFASHIHGYFSGVWQGVPYTITGGAGGKLQGDDPNHFFHHYVTVHVHQGMAETVVKRINPEGGIMRLFDFVEDDVFEWGLLVGAGILLLTLGPTIKRDMISPMS